ncbi:MAG: putative signal peptide protein [Bacteroidota bacterium]|jgi:hypothetical protein
MKKLLLSIAAFAALGWNANAQDCDCMIPLDETFQVVPFWGGQAPDYRNDDGSSEEIALPFTFDFFGLPQTSCYINNNGNISFGGGYSSFTASGFPIQGYAMVAAFWADVDTRDLGSGLVYYKVTDHAIIVRYNAVGYFSNQSDKLNDFQMILSDGQSDLIGNGHNISFCYGDMQWTTGSASAGSNGFGGSPANIGANSGNDVNSGLISALQIGLFNLEGNNYDGPYGNNDGIDYLDYSNISFATGLASENQPPINVSNLCDTIIGNPGDTLVFYFYDEYIQDLGIDIIDSSGGFDPLDSLSGFVIENGIIQELRDMGDRNGDNNYLALVIDPSIPDGVYNIMINVSDNGTPVATSHFPYTIQIGEAIPNNLQEKSPLAITPVIKEGTLFFTGLENQTVQQFNLYSSTGQNLIQTDRLINGINMDNLPSGVYLYSMKVNGRSYTGKIAH